MKIRTWHVGKIVMLWAWGVAAMVAGLCVLGDNVKSLTQHVLIGFALLILLLVIPIILSILTWTWLGGKEAEANAPPVRPRQSEPRD